MGYWMPNAEVRKVVDAKVYKPFTVRKLTCDPCALCSERYEIETEYGTERLAWWELLTPWDSARDRYLKWRTNREVARLNEAARLAQQAAYRANRFGDVHLPETA